MKTNSRKMDLLFAQQRKIWIGWKGLVFSFSKWIQCKLWVSMRRINSLYSKNDFLSRFLQNEKKKKVKLSRVDSLRFEACVLFRNNGKSIYNKLNNIAFISDPWPTPGVTLIRFDVVCHRNIQLSIEVSVRLSQ